MLPDRYAELPLVPAAVPPANQLADIGGRDDPSWLERDLAAAREVQRRLLPPLEQHWRGVDMLAEYRPAHAIGGDFFHVATRARGRLVAMVGDVAGKGVAAALLMAAVIGEVRRVARRDLHPGRILAALNRSLDGQDMGDRFVTAGCVALDLPRAVWTAASAGHPPALLFRRSGAMEVLGAGGPGLGLGCVQSWRCDEHEVPALPGDTLIMMTDGLTDCLDPADVAATVARASAAGPDASTASLHDLRREILAAAAALPASRDDATWLSLRLTGALPGYC